MMRPICRCARIERWRRRTKPSRFDYRPDHDGARVGRHSGTEHAVAALVAMDLLRVHPLLDRLLGRLSLWPLLTGYTHGAVGYSNARPCRQDLKAIQALRAQTEAGLDKASVKQIVADKKLLGLALAHGKAAFGDNCAPCHGSGGQGGKGYRNLTNDDWLWGGSSTRSRPRSPTASAPIPTRTRAPARCPRSAMTAS